MTTPRRATGADIPCLMDIRGAVIENRLSDTNSVTQADYDCFVAKGRVWVVEEEGRVVGFSASDCRDGSIWALFLDPAFQGMGLGAQLLDLACEDLVKDGFATARLTTDPGTRAERLYRRRGWGDCGVNDGGEIQFELGLRDWAGSCL